MAILPEDTVQDFVRDLQRRGYTKYAATKELEVEAELTYEKSYYLVRKYWQPPTVGGKKHGDSE